MNFIIEPWPWYVVGPAIGLFVPLMVLLNKVLGLSSNLRHFCAIMIPKSKLTYLKYDVKPYIWNLFFFGGLFLGGMIGHFYLSNPNTLPVLPENYHNFKYLILLFGGGVFIGFGTRYADGCTSGHSISGLSNFQKSSLLATLSFFAGGLTMSLVNYLLGGVL